MNRLLPPIDPFLAPLCGLLLFLVASPLAGGPLEVGNASGRPGELIEVPVRLTFEDPLLAYVFPLQFDATRIELVGITADGTAAAHADPLGLESRVFAPGDGFVGLRNTGTASKEFQVPPGERKLVGKLQFRVLAAAPVGNALIQPVEKIPQTAGGPSYEVDGGGIPKGVSLAASDLIGGSVEVLPPTGPRPVGSLTCEQVLDRVELMFTLTESYDSLEISRDGAPVATIPGAESSFAESLPGLSNFTYAVTALRGDQRSVEATCQVTVASPAAPTIEDLTCTGGSLAWTNPVTYDRILITKNDESLAVLPGSSTSYTDLDPEEETTLYSVIGELEGFLSPRVHCMENGVWIMEAGNVAVPVDAERVSVPIYVTTSATIRGLDCYIDMDMSRLELIWDREAALEDTVGHPDPEFFAMGISGAYQTSVPATGIVWDYFNPREEEKDLSVGLRQHVVNFIFQPNGVFTEGETVTVSFHGGSFTLPPATAQKTGLFIPGQIRFGAAGPEPVENLQALVAAEGNEGGDGGGGGSEDSDVQLSWRNGSVYEKVRIERNGTILTEISGESTTYVDPQVPLGVFTYKVMGVSQDLTSFPTGAFLSTITPKGAFLRGDSNQDGKINIVDAVVTLDYLFRGGPAVSCADGADADDNGRLSLTDAIVTLHYLFRGGTPMKAPGTLYPWYDPTPDGLSCD